MVNGAVEVDVFILPSTGPIVSIAGVRKRSSIAPFSDPCGTASTTTACIRPNRTNTPSKPLAGKLRIAIDTLTLPEFNTRDGSTDNTVIAEQSNSS